MAFNREEFFTLLNNKKALTEEERRKQLHDYLVSSDITELDLRFYKIDSVEKLSALGKALNGTHITTLNLGVNQIDSVDKLSALGKTLNGTHITTLNLGSNWIDNNCTAALIELLKTNPTITSLDLSDNPDLSEESRKAILEQLSTNQVTAAPSQEKGGALKNMLSMRIAAGEFPDQEEGLQNVPQDVKDLVDSIREKWNINPPGQGNGMSI